MQKRCLIVILAIALTGCSDGGENGSHKNSAVTLINSDLRTVFGVEKILKQLKYLDAAPDGKWDESTIRALKRFQEDAGLTVDGISGPKTREALSNASRFIGIDDSIQVKYGKRFIGRTELSCSGHSYVLDDLISNKSVPLSKKGIRISSLKLGEGQELRDGISIAPKVIGRAYNEENMILMLSFVESQGRGMYQTVILERVERSEKHMPVACITISYLPYIVASRSFILPGISNGAFVIDSKRFLDESDELFDFQVPCCPPYKVRSIFSITPNSIRLVERKTMETGELKEIIKRKTKWKNTQKEMLAKLRDVKRLSNEVSKLSLRVTSASSRGERLAVENEMRALQRKLKEIRRRTKWKNRQQEMLAKLRNVRKLSNKVSKLSLRATRASSRTERLAVENEIRVLQRNHREELVASAIRMIPIYDKKSKSFHSFDSHMRSETSRSSGRSNVERDPVGAGLSIFFNSSSSNIKKQLGLR